MRSDIYMHINDALLDQSGNIQQEKTNQVARAGDNWYMLANDQSLFRVSRPGSIPGIGIDALPENIRISNILTGNHLAQLASVTQIPNIDFSGNHIIYDGEEALHMEIKKNIDDGNIDFAWQILLKNNTSKIV